MISKTKIGKRVTRKTNPEVVATLLNAKKHKEWISVAQKLSNSRKRYVSINLHSLDKLNEGGDTFVVVGKVLGEGKITKKMKVCALSFSAIAKSKLDAEKCEHMSLIEEIKKNPEAKGVKIIV